MFFLELEEAHDGFVLGRVLRGDLKVSPAGIANIRVAVIKPRRASLGVSRKDRGILGMPREIPCAVVLHGAPVPRGLRFVRSSKQQAVGVTEVSVNGGNASRRQDENGKKDNRKECDPTFA